MASLNQLISLYALSIESANPASQNIKPDFFTSHIVWVIIILFLIFTIILEIFATRGYIAKWTRRLGLFEDKLLNLRINDWQLSIAENFLNYVKKFGELYDELLNKIDRISPGLVGIMLFIPPLAAITLILFTDTSKTWFLTLIILSMSSHSMLFIFAVISSDLGNTIFFKWLRSSKIPSEDILSAFVPFFLSIWFTIVSLIIVLFLNSSDYQSYWYLWDIDRLRPSRPLLLAIINFPFDLLTIFVSVKLLMFVTKNEGRYMVLIALIDIIISAILVIILHSLLKTIEPGGLQHIFQNISKSVLWLTQLVTLKASANNSDWLLTPTLLTAFIPVSIYMFLLIFLGIIIKPFAWASRLLCIFILKTKKVPWIFFGFVIDFILLFIQGINYLITWPWFQYYILKNITNLF